LLTSSLTSSSSLFNSSTTGSAGGSITSSSGSNISTTLNKNLSMLGKSSRTQNQQNTLVTEVFNSIKVI
jgi:hypothetical protein